MPYAIYRTKVADYNKWKKVFDEDAANRQAGGSKGGKLFRDASDPNVVVMLFEWDLEQGRQYSQGDDLREKMQKAGVLGPPDIFFLEEIEQLQLTGGSAPRPR